MIKTQDMQVFEILNEVVKLPEEKQVEKLRSYQNHTPLQYILKWNFDSTIISVLPEGTPPFNSSEEDGPSKQSLWTGLKLFPTFVQSSISQKMQRIAIEKQFIDLLESIDPAEAEVVILTKDKNLTSVYDISVETVSKAFPDLITKPIDQPERIITPEEKAKKLLELAERKKEQAKQLNAEARELSKEAKTLTGE